MVWLLKKPLLSEDDLIHNFKPVLIYKDDTTN